MFFTYSCSNPTSTDKKPFYFGNAVFEWLFPVVTAIVAGAELMLREQVLFLFYALRFSLLCHTQPFMCNVMTSSC